jgi:hydrogenase/urease accessory protein HupE
LVLVSVVAMMLPRRAGAHDFSPGVLALAETAPGTFDVAWTEPVDSVGAPAGVSVAFPTQCVRTTARVECGPTGLRGEISFHGLHEDRMQVVVSIRYADGRTHEELVTGADPQSKIGAAHRSIAESWVRLGLEHIATGLDHIAFVLGLLLLMKSRRMLLLTVTAFTVAHSVTLALAALDVLRLPRAPVEATIAASVLLLAREACHEEPTLTRRLPWAVASLFGLVHGLGFASALVDLGLPNGSRGAALFFFNVGIELGQLVIVFLALLVVRVARTWLSGATWPRLASAYLLGAAAAWWLIERTVAIVEG